MNTRLLTIDDPQAIPTARQIIKEGGLIAFPTDTIYGVACDAFDPQAILAVFTAKGRPDEKALPVLMGEFHQLDQLVLHVDERLQRISSAFWPGPLTIVTHKNPAIPAELSPYPTIGVRMPDLGFALALLCETGPLATTSANISGGANPVDAESVIAQLGGRINLVLDGGPTPGPTASTVVDLSGPEMNILRQGPISLADLQAVLSD
jgi:L-threonylcarbamoyladenylate synthase